MFRSPSMTNFELQSFEKFASTGLFCGHLFNPNLPIIILTRIVKIYSTRSCSIIRKINSIKSSTLAVFLSIFCAWYKFTLHRLSFQNERWGRVTHEPWSPGQNWLTKVLRVGLWDLFPTEIFCKFVSPQMPLFTCILRNEQVCKRVSKIIILA